METVRGKPPLSAKYRDDPADMQAVFDLPELAVGRLSGRKSRDAGLNQVQNENGRGYPLPKDDLPWFA